VKNTSPKHVAATFFLVLTLLSPLALAQKIGSSNTATADPTVPHPNTQPCKVVLFANYKFAGFNPQSFSYAPPADCPAPWAKVILEANFAVSKGIQYDRTANIWLGTNNIYFGTTSEPDPSDARNWHIERDLTDYSSIFTVAQTGNVDLGNLYNKQYNGLLEGGATLYFYPLAANELPPSTADQVIGFSGGTPGNVGTVGLGNSGSLLEQTLTLPTNIDLAYFDVFAQSQSSDEFWYTCVPNDVATELQSCGGTAFREGEVTIDGTPAGVAPIFPWIYTGGIDPFLWIPIPGVQTLNFQLYRVNLTPFVSLLDDGQPHTIALSVFNADNYFSATANLLLYLDPDVTQFTGAVTENTLAVPSPVIKENIHTGTTGNINGTVNTLSSHNFVISGYINYPKGPVTTTVAQSINFSNLQDFKIAGPVYTQDIKQDTIIRSATTIDNLGGKFVNTADYFWPLTVDIRLLFNSDGSITQKTSISQEYERDTEAIRNGQATSFSVLRNRVTPVDTLFLTSSFQITGNTDQSSAQSFFASNSTGYCYSKSLTAANNVLTGITNGAGCN
jgi:Peptide N-acetyl-beta-D-glucosaminyl asparaginase amidase A